MNRNKAPYGTGTKLAHAVARMATSHQIPVQYTQQQSRCMLPNNAATLSMHVTNILSAAKLIFFFLHT
jgi:hypothetical protein